MFPLSNNQLKFISEIFISLGQVFVASLVVEYFVRDFKTGLLLSGVVLSLACWFIGLIVTKKINS